MVTCQARFIQPLLSNVTSLSGDLLFNAGKVLKSFSKVLNGIAWDLKANALLKMAISIGILVAAIWVLTQIDDIGKLWIAVGVIGALALILVGLAFAMGKLSEASLTYTKKDGLNIDGLKTSLLQIGLAILLLALTVKMIGKMDQNEAEKGFKGLAAIAVGMIVFLAAIGRISRYSGDVGNFGKIINRNACYGLCYENHSPNGL